MNTGILLQSEKDTNHSKTDGMRKHDSKNAATPGTGPGCQQKHSATCKPKGSKTKLPYQEIQRLHEQGLTGVEIAKQLGLSDNSVYRVLRKLGLGAACHKHKREVLADGKVLCYICEERKDVSEFNHGYAYCRPCGYAKMAMRSNENLNKRSTSATSTSAVVQNVSTSITSSPTSNWSSTMSPRGAGARTAISPW